MAGSKITGADDLAKALASLGGSLTAPLNAAARKSLRPMLAAAMRNAPKDDGDLAKSLTIKPAKSPKSRPKHVVGPAANYVGKDGAKPVRYAHLTEFGTADGTQAGTRWMTASFEETADQTIKELGAAIGPEIEKAAVRRAKRIAKRS